MAQAETPVAPCELCAEPGGALLWKDERCRVVRVDGADGEGYPGFCRVIWHNHVRELSDLSRDDRHHLLDVLTATERAVRLAVGPDKINLASLGNLTPHLHWHVIPRWRDDSRFPAAIWAPVQRQATAHGIPANTTLKRCLEQALDEMRMT